MFGSLSKAYVSATRRALQHTQSLFGPAGLAFMRMAAHMDHVGQPMKLLYGQNGHGADLANGGIDKDWDFHADIPDRMAGSFAEKDFYAHEL